MYRNGAREGVSSEPGAACVCVYKCTMRHTMRHRDVRNCIDKHVLDVGLFRKALCVPEAGFYLTTALAGFLARNLQGVSRSL